MEELESEGDLRILVSDYLKGLNSPRNVISGIIRLAFTRVNSSRLKTTMAQKVFLRTVYQGTFHL